MLQPLLEAAYFKVVQIKLSCFNIKITRPDDLIFGEAILNKLQLTP